MIEFSYLSFDQSLSRMFDLLQDGFDGTSEASKN